MLDTHVLVWAFAEPVLLGVDARDMLEDPANEVLFSSVSLWELLIKTRSGKLAFDHRELASAASNAGFSAIGLGMVHLDVLEGLPKHHGDPFDHLLIAQALAEDAAFMSGDRMVAQYPVELIAAR